MGVLRQRLASFLRTYGADAALVVALVVLTLVVRFLTLEPIENGGDPLDNWYFVRQWAYDNDPARSRLDHHASRFGIHWITWIAQTVFGTHPRVYYVPQLFASTACSVLTYLLGRQVSGRVTGFLCVLFLLECEPFISASSQLRPAIFETMYALASAVCLVRFLETAGRAAYVWLTASAVLVFLAYLSHEPDAFLVAGMLPVVWLKRRSFRDLFWFVGLLAALVICETTAYLVLTRYWGRVDVVTQSHLEKGGASHDFWFLLERFTEADPAIRLAYYPFFVAGPLLFVLRRSLKERAVVLMAGGFLFLVTFLVRSVDPVLVFMRNNDRYILVTVPFAYVATIHCGLVLGRALIERFAARAVVALRRLPRFVLPSVASAVALALMIAVGSRAAEVTRKPHPFRDVDRIADILNDTYRRGLPIIGKVTKRMPKIVQVRALHWAHKGFLNDEFFLEGGSLRNFSYNHDLAVLTQEERYLPDTPELDAERVRELEKKGCALRLTTRGTFVELSQKKRLPARCHP